MPEKTDPLRVEYLASICEAITLYVRQGGTIQLHSERDSDPLTIWFTLDDGDAYHLVLRAVMAERSAAD